MTRADRAFVQLLLASGLAGMVLAIPLAITLFPAASQRLLHGANALAEACAAALYRLGLELPPLGTVVLIAATASVAFGTVKALGILRRTRRVLAQKRPAAVPARAARAAARVGIANDLRCFEDPRPFTYCAGLLRPRIWISTGAIQHLRRAELEAVLWHEEYHLRRHDPLRTLVARVLGRFFFLLPLVRVLGSRFEVAAELDADRNAVRRQGTVQHVASALYALSRFPFPFATEDVALGAWSTSHARVDQLCGATDAALLPGMPRRARWLTTASLTIALFLTLGQGARANLVPSAVIEAISPASAADIHVCPLPKDGPLL